LSIQILSLVKHSPMRRTKPYILLALVIGLLLAATLLFRSQLQQHNKINATLWALVIHKDDFLKKQSAVSELATFGSAAYPHIARAFHPKYTFFDRAYDLAGRKLPRPLRTYFPARPSRAELRRAVATSLYDLGPTASRALLNEIEIGLKDLNAYESATLLRALYWSIPESPRAALILSNYLAHPEPGKPLFGMTDALEIWPHVTHLAPLLPPWLRQFTTSAEAAEALGLMGTNAAFALPLLVDIAKNRFISSPTVDSRHGQGSPSYIPDNRAAAIEALGNIGIGTPEVLEVLRQAFTDPSDRIRNEATLAFGTLGAKALPALDYFLANIDRKNPSVLQHQLHALAQFGTNAAAAVPLLLELSQDLALPILGNINRLPSASPMGLHHIWIWRNEPKPGMIAAALALTQIDLHAAKDRIDVLALALRYQVPTNVLRSLRVYKSELIPKLDAHLHVGEPLGTLRPPFGPLGMPILRIILAHNILALDSENQPARRLLQTAMTDTDPTMRALAANWFYKATGDTNQTLPIIAESLRHVKTGDDQALIRIVTDFGPHAKPLIPHLEPFLSHPDQFIRNLTGKALRSANARKSLD